MYHKHGETLKLYNVRREDAGEIMCIANNGILPIISRQFKLIVTCKEQPFRIYRENIYY